LEVRQEEIRFELAYQCYRLISIVSLAYNLEERFGLKQLE